MTGVQLTELVESLAGSAKKLDKARLDELLSTNKPALLKSNSDALAAHLRANQVPLRFEPTQVRMPPYGSVRSFAVQAPNGTWLEFFEEEGE